MKNKLIRITCALGLLVAIGSITTSCSVEDGIDGTNGINGTNGADGIDGINGADGANGINGVNGADGADGADGVDGADGINGSDGVDGDGVDGADGEDGLGLNDLAKFGAISLNLSGTRPDEVEFAHESTLKFVPNRSEGNSVRFQDNNIIFDLHRFLGTPDSHLASSVRLMLQINDAGLETQNYAFNIGFNDYKIIFDDLKFMTMYSSFNQGQTGVTNFEITDYSFDDTTNNLKFSFSLDVAGANNPTEHDISISGTVDTIVLEQLGNMIN